MKLNDKSKILKNIALLSQIGISMIVPIVGGILFGNFLDNKFGTNVIFLAIFSILGILSAFVNLYKIAMKGNKRK